MKLEVIDEQKIILYLYNYYFISYEKEIITKEIKKIFLKLIKNYSLKMSGFYDIFVYENKKYGTILEIIKKDELLFNPDLIDIKVKMIKDVSIYLKTKDYFAFSNYKNIYYFDNCYYIDIEEINNLFEVIEFVDILYKEKKNYLNNMLLIK